MGSNRRRMNHIVFNVLNVLIVWSQHWLFHNMLERYKATAVCAPAKLRQAQFSMRHGQVTSVIQIVSLCQNYHFYYTMHKLPLAVWFCSGSPCKAYSKAGRAAQVWFGGRVWFFSRVFEKNMWEDILFQWRSKGGGGLFDSWRGKQKKKISWGSFKKGAFKMRTENYLGIRCSKIVMCCFYV